MNIVQLVLKQMRQRSLSTWLTLLSVMLGVTLVIAILILRREGASLFGQSDYGFDVLVGPKSSALQLTLNTLYHLDRSPGNIPYSLYDELDHGEKFKSLVRLAVPFAVGDSYKGLRIVGTSTKMFGQSEEGQPMGADAFEYRPGKHYQFAQGRVFHPHKFEAVIGSETAQRTGLKIGDTFQATHGLPKPDEAQDIHAEKWTVVGILQPTHTANDHVLFIPLTTFYCIFEHEEGLAAHAQIRQGAEPGQVSAQTAHHEHHEGEEAKSYIMNADGTIDLKLPKDQWELSAVLVKARNPMAVQTLLYNFASRTDAGAVNPASTMHEFFSTFLDSSAKVLLLVAGLVTIVAAASIMTTIYNSVSARRREMAILRALGATRTRVLTLICVEAVIIGLAGGLAGFVAGHLIAAVGSIYMNQMVGEGLNWMSIGPEEWVYLLAVVAIALIAGLVPALKAYATPVATNLVVS